MATYRTVSLTFWTDPKVDDDFTPEDKYFYLYLITNPHTNICGCYEISMKQMVRETGYNEDTIKRLLQRMESIHDVIRYDAKTKEVLIVRWGKYNWVKSIATQKGVMKCADSIKSESFRAFVVEGATELNDGEPYAPYRGPIGPMGVTVTVPVTDNTPIIDEWDIEDSFNTFWKEYPRKVGKGAARKSFEKAMKKADLKTILDAVKAQRQSPQWTKDDGQFIPHPATWLNQERWADEVQTGDGLDNLRNLYAMFKEEEANDKA